MNQGRIDVQMADIQQWRWLVLYPETKRCLPHLLPPLPFNNQYVLIRPHGVHLRGVTFSREDMLQCRQCDGPVTFRQFQNALHVC